MKTSHAYLLTVALLGLTACTATTEDTHHLKNVTLGAAGVPGISVDAKQRFVWAPRRQNGTGKPSIANIICAEPSPDALSQLASAVAVQAQLQVTTGQTQVGGQGSFEKSFSEAVQNIGKRTAAIQLLRDGLYRACEAYANDGIDDFGYTLVLTNIDNVMLKLVALETLAANAAPTDSAGKEALAAAENAKTELSQLDSDITAARENDRQARGSVNKGHLDADQASARVVGLKAQKVGVESSLGEDQKKLKTEEDRNPPAADKATKVKALTSAIDKKKLQLVKLDADIAAAASTETKAKARLATAQAQATAVAGQLTTLLTKLGPARSKLTTTSVAASGVDRQLTVSGAAAIVEIATKSSGIGSIAAACLAWMAKNGSTADPKMAKNGSTANPKMISYCDMVMARFVPKTTTK